MKDAMQKLDGFLSQAREDLRSGLDRQTVIDQLQRRVTSELSPWGGVTVGQESLAQTLAECERRGDNSWTAAHQEGVAGLFTVATWREE
ncbi:MAG: hypothetical protein ABFD16_20825 [Thermoguttaceae bacterium]|jgi:hypothetical protein